MIKYLKGDATYPQGNGDKVIVHVCNDIGAWGSGFVLAISKRWRFPEREYKRWSRRQEISIPFELGQVQFVRAGEDIWVANMIGQHDIKPINNVPPVRYEAIREGLMKVAQFAKDHHCSIHMPRMGSVRAGGSWKEIEKIINEVLAGHNEFVYDLK